MMAGQFKEYNWRDIMRLVYKDAGLETEEDIRTKGEYYIKSNLITPVHERDTCLEVRVFDKPFSERIQDHAGD